MPSLFTLSVVVFGVFGAARGQCIPSFGKSPVTITGESGRVTPERINHSLSGTSWFIEQMGTDPKYTLRNYDYPNQVLTRVGPTSLTIRNAPQCGHDGEIFIILCDICAPVPRVPNTGCNLLPNEFNTTLCVAQSNATESDLELQTCSNDGFGQFFTLSQFVRFRTPFGGY